MHALGHSIIREQKGRIYWKLLVYIIAGGGGRRPKKSQLTSQVSGKMRPEAEASGAPTYGVLSWGRVSSKSTPLRPSFCVFCASAKPPGETLIGPAWLTDPPLCLTVLSDHREEDTFQKTTKRASLAGRKRWVFCHRG